MLLIPDDAVDALKLKADTLVVANVPVNLLLTKTTLSIVDPNTSTLRTYTDNMVLDNFNNVNYGLIDKSVETITCLPSGWCSHCRRSPVVIPDTGL